MGALIGILGSRLMAWVVLGGGGLLVGLSLYNGIKSRGAQIEAGKWKAAHHEQVKDNRAANRSVDDFTRLEGMSLQEQENALRQKWKTMGRDRPTEKGKE